VIFVQKWLFVSLSDARSSLPVSAVKNLLTNTAKAARRQARKQVPALQNIPAPRRKSMLAMMAQTRFYCVEVAARLRVAANQSEDNMKTQFGIMALVFLTVCGSATSKENPITRVSKEQRLTQPPAGKVLVNFHHVTTYGLQRYAIFNKDGHMICDLPGKSEFQFVCEPGEHIFFGWADQVNVVKADLAADKVYDIMVDVSMGMIRANVMLNPLKKDSPRRARLTEFETRENLVTYTHGERAQEYETKQQQRIADIKRDFLGGEKSDRIKNISIDDCR
jgi:hypothetical protein